MQHKSLSFTILATVKLEWLYLYLMNHYSFKCNDIRITNRYHVSKSFQIFASGKKKDILDYNHTQNPYISCNKDRCF